MGDTVSGYSLSTGQRTSLPLSDLKQTIAYSGDFISTITVVYRGTTFVQTFLNNGTNITNVSQFLTT